jgi:transcriptional regulator with XRE-family HTH domain
MPTILELRKATRPEKSRARVAADLDISERHLYRLETGKAPLRPIVALAIAAYYGVDVNQIVGVRDEAA